MSIKQQNQACFKDPAPNMPWLEKTSLCRLTKNIGNFTLAIQEQGAYLDRQFKNKVPIWTGNTRTTGTYLDR